MQKDFSGNTQKALAGLERKPFTLVLSGGGARGFAHVGVLRALESYGLQPSAIVGVSMGAVVGVVYSLRPDWYPALLGVDTSFFPGPLVTGVHARRAGGWLRQLAARITFVRDLTLSWGPGKLVGTRAPAVLHSLTRGQPLEAGRVPVAVSTTLPTS